MDAQLDPIKGRSGSGYQKCIEQSDNYLQSTMADCFDKGSQFNFPHCKIRKDFTEYASKYLIAKPDGIYRNLGYNLNNNKFEYKFKGLIKKFGLEMSVNAC